MSHSLPRWARLAAALLVSGLVPLLAQLNPVLRVTEPDFLDLYQKSATQVIKPEIITVLDFSGSMNAVMWHPKYYTGTAETANLPASYPTNGGDDAWARPYVRTFDRTNGPTINFLWYINGRSPQTSPFREDGKLIKANGEQVALADVGTAGNANRYPINWIKQATHVRMTMTHPSSGVARQLDLPIPWKVFDSPAGTESLPSYSASTAADPQNGNRATEFDTLYADDSNVYSESGDVTGYWSDNYDWLGHFWYQQDYLYWLFFGKTIANDATNPTGTIGNPGGDYVIPDVPSGAKAFLNGIPCLTRYQGVKRAVIMAWLANQTRVYWAYRFLDADDEQGNGGVRTSVDPDNGSQNGTGRNLRILRPATGNNPDPSVRDLQSAEPAGGTPLTYAMANALAQFNVLRNSVFDAPHTTDKYVSPQCQTMFLILFTDGIANDAYWNGREWVSVLGTGNPYPVVPQPDSCNANVGNQTLGTSYGNLDPGRTYFNIQSLAGVAAHAADPEIPTHATVPNTYPTGNTQALDRFAPFFVKQRGSGTANQTVFTTPRPIQTFTVGVSLAGAYTEPASSKYSLLLAAAAGDPNQATWDINRAAPYSATNPGTFFFDARDPAVLVSSLVTAIQTAADSSNNQATSAPSIPFSGVALANQVYVGQFKPPLVGNPLWTGDLMMFPTRTQNLATTMVDASGNPLSILNCSTAMWSVARDVFNVASVNSSGAGKAGKACGPTSSTGTGSTGCGPSGDASPVNWSARRILTRLAATGSAPNPDVTPFTDADPAFSLIKGSLPASLTTDTARAALVNFIRGADPNSTASPKANRSTIMGDIIDSVPNVLEYTWSGVTFGKSLPSNVQTALTSHPRAKLRVVFVGTNQGFLHAFAEATWPVSQTVNGVPVTVTNGTVGELWAFLPTDFLPYLDYLQNTSNTHRYGVDGTALCYTLDLPASGAVTGNGTVDPTEKALVVFGLRKGGRGYYALDVHDPTDPHLVWALRPEEAATMPTARFLNGDATNGRNLVANMGMSSAYLAPARVIYGNKVRDVLLIGGGLSSSALETSLGSSSLGRQVVAMDIQTGEILQAWNLLTLSGLPASTVGAVATGVVPFQVFPTSGLHQRGYFTDTKGGVWAIGSGQTRTAEPLRDFRTDTSYLDQWVTNSGGLSLRRLYSDTSANGMITTLPDPTLLADFPVLAASSTNLLHPTAVAIPFVTGNRSNPLDFNYSSSNPAPTQHRLNVIYDRQDSRLTGVDTTPITTGTMADFSNSTNPKADAINPNAASYYLKTKYGYYVNFPAATSTTSGGATTYYIPKGITDPSVLAYVLFYSYFTPTESDPCQGGKGNTSTNVICNLVNPVVDSSGDATATCISGNRATWTGVASNFSALGTIAVIQAGMVNPATTPPTGDSTIMQLQTILGNASERYPRVRVWRTIPKS